MKKELFAELVESINEGGRILKGRAKPKRAFKYDELDVRKIRERLHLSQTKFPRLATASPEKLKQVRLRIQGRVLRWEALDEDIWVGDVVAGRFPK